MPTVLRSGPYRFYFFAHDSGEPPHVHVDRDRLTAKFWLRPVLLARISGFSAVEQRRLDQIVRSHQKDLLEAWNEFFG